MRDLYLLANTTIEGEAMKNNLKGLRRRLEAIERASRLVPRGVWVTGEEIERVKAALRRKLNLSPGCRVGREDSNGFFQTTTSTAAAREKLQQRIAMLREAAMALSPTSKSCECEAN